MDQKKNGKTATLIISLVILCLASLRRIVKLSSVGICTGCGLAGRLSYPFFHAGILHAGINVWCLLSVVFIYDISLRRLCLAYIVAVSVPTFCLSETVTVGMSGLVFVLFGSISFEVKRKLYYQACMFAGLVTGFFFPNINAGIHLYCYLAGVAGALLNKR